LGEETIPQVEREVRVCAAEASNQVILERSDGSFGGVGAVNARRNQLEIDLLAAEECLQSGGTFIVEALELGAEAGGDESVVDGLVGG
jgi:hypothetical protein